MLLVVTQMIQVLKMVDRPGQCRSRGTVVSCDIDE